ncbi:phage regulatory CII family protein [Acidovorax sp. NCPPB 3576]|uniref:phage regulatory CII family protein n=1 Tax=Acidovorax sp. NCPPB 3576 TaxID=2940488 RepID=UPI00234BA655|nr:phage regulatory CII family protein [Acidovorax sp. NCPPB 3576]WCM86673.1 transcriptional regulator [Acidovorax sp. NCPPB 3576]
MSLHDSLRRGADSFPGGRAVISLRLGKTDEVLRKELAGSATHKLGAMDALAIARLCVETKTPHCFDYASFVAQECGGRFVPDDEAEPKPSIDPMRKVSRLMRETSDVTSIVIEALSDGVISDNELACIEQEIAEAEEVLRRLRRAAQAVNAQGKPKSERSHVNLPVLDRMERQAASPFAKVGGQPTESMRTDQLVSE